MNEYIVSIVKAVARRNSDTLRDFHKAGAMIVAGELTYDQVRDDAMATAKECKLAPATVKVYVSQGYAIAQALTTWAEVRKYADDRCKGSRSLKRVYDALKADAKGEAEGDEGEADEAEAVTATALIDVILANLAHLTDKGEIAQVRDAAIAMLG